MLPAPLEPAFADQIGAEGVVFEEGYVTSPTCAPSRAGIMTGRVQNRYGFETQVMEFYPSNYVEYISGRWLVDTGEFKVKAKPSFPAEWQGHKQGVPPTQIMLSEILKKYNYDTALIGKWHLGVHREQVPMARGFDYQYGFYGAFSLYAPKKNWSGIINHEHESFSAQHQWNTGRKEQSAIMRNQKEIEEEEYLTFAFRDEINKYMEEHKDEPFFIYGAFSAPHVPFQAPVEYYCQYPHVEDENKRVYYSMISALDDAIGDIHQKIKDLGIENDTIIWFLSDNGGPVDSNASLNAPLNGQKGILLEGGVRVPAFAWWPGVIEEGQVVGDIVHVTDLYTTFARLGDAMKYIPTDRVVDGLDQTALLLNGDTHSRRDYVFIYAGHELGATVKGRYKRHWIGAGDVAASGMPEAYYDLYMDPREENPQLVPLIHTQGQFNRMRARHELMKKKYPDMPNGKGIPYTGLSNARPETKAIKDMVENQMKLMPIDVEKYIQFDGSKMKVNGDWGH